MSCGTSISPCRGRCRYSPDLCFGGANCRSRRRPLRPRREVFADAEEARFNDGSRYRHVASPAAVTESIMELLFAVLYHGSLAAALGLRWLFSALSKALREAKSAATKRDATARKGLRTGRKRARHPAPAPETLRKHWKLSRESLEGKILLGSLVGDLACAVDATYVRGDGGEIVGRNGGIRGWLRKNAPELSPHYKTLMHYKAVADKFRLACGVEEPDGAEEALGATMPEHAGTAKKAPTRNEKATELLEKSRTMRALDEALHEALGLIRYRRRAS